MDCDVPWIMMLSLYPTDSTITPACDWSTRCHIITRVVHSSPEQPVFNYLKACGDTSYWSRSRHNPELVTVHGCSGPHSHVSKGQIWVGAVHACLEAVKPDSYYCHHFHDYPERLDAFISCSRKPSRWWLRLHHHMNVGYAESNCWRWLEPSHGCVNFFICG